jgi:hypothetical protein
MIPLWLAKNVEQAAAAWQEVGHVVQTNLDEYETNLPLPTKSGALIWVEDNEVHRAAVSADGHYCVGPYEDKPGFHVSLYPKSDRNGQGVGVEIACDVPTIAEAKSKAEAHWLTWRSPGPGEPPPAPKQKQMPPTRRTKPKVVPQKFDGPRAASAAARGIARAFKIYTLIWEQAGSWGKDPIMQAHTAIGFYHVAPAKWGDALHHYAVTFSPAGGSDKDRCELDNAKTLDKAKAIAEADWMTRQVPPTPPTAAELVTSEGPIDAASDELVWEAGKPHDGHSSHKATAGIGWYALSPTFALGGGDPFQGYHIGHSPSGGYITDPDYCDLGTVRSLAKAKAKAAADWAKRQATPQTADHVNLSPATEPALEQVPDQKVEVLDKPPVNNKPPTNDELDIPESFKRKRPVPAKE